MIASSLGGYTGKAPTSKLQAPEKLQMPSSKGRTLVLLWCLSLELPREARLAAFDGRSDLVAPLRPRAVVVSHVLQTEQIGEDKPGVARALANPAVNDRVRSRFQSAPFQINFRQL